MISSKHNLRQTHVIQKQITKIQKEWLQNVPLVTTTKSTFSTTSTKRHASSTITNHDSKNPYFPNLFKPLYLGPDIGTLPNRVLMGSMHTGLEGHSIPKPLLHFLKPDHLHDELSALAVYFEERAKGGVGLMVTGGISPNKSGWVGPFASKLDSYHEMELHKQVTERVHSVQVPTYPLMTEDGGISKITENFSEKARICIQILHAGRYAHHPFPVSASSTKSPISQFKARELSLSEVQSTIQDFVQCAVLAKEAGYDGAEIMGSEGYLINQFLVTHTNKRKGHCYFNQRMEFAVNIVRETRRAVGRDFIIIFRLSMLDLIQDGSSWDEIKLLAQAIEDAGATIINTGIGWHEARIPTIATCVPRGAFSWVTKKLRDEKILSIPLCTTNRINAPHVADKIIESESADMVSMARPFLADPDILKKSREGRTEQINTCIACNQACLDHVFVGKTASCLVNPRACHETEFSVEPDSIREEDKLNIGVIGSGPAGLAFATTAATIGHNVTLFDKSTEIGGQFNMAKRIPGKEEFHETIRYFKWLTNDLQQKGKLDLKLGCEVSTTDMENNKSIDKWIIATGVNPRIPRIPGIEHPNVLSYIDVLRNNATVGKKVAIIGAGGIGFDVAEFLLHQGDKTADEVSVPEFLSDWGIDIENRSRGGLLERTLSSTTPPKRQLYLMQRKKGKLGAGLGKTTGWIHRSTLTKSKAVTMLDSVSYDKIDENGFLHITMSKGKSKESMILDVDNIIICAGQTPKNDLEEKVGGDLKKSVFTIGGAYEALELDAKRAIDMGTRLALKIHDPSIVPGKHKLESGKGPEEKLYNIMKKYLS